MPSSPPAEPAASLHLGTAWRAPSHTRAPLRAVFARGHDSRANLLRRLMYPAAPEGVILMFINRFRRRRRCGTAARQPVLASVQSLEFLEARRLFAAGDL